MAERPTRSGDIDERFVREGARWAFRVPAWFMDQVMSQGPKVSRRFAVKRAVWKAMVDLWVHGSSTVEDVLSPQLLSAYRKVPDRGPAGEAFLQATLQSLFGYDDDTIEWYSHVEEPTVADWHLRRAVPVATNSEFGERVAALPERAGDDVAVYYAGTNMCLARQVIKFGIRPRSSIAPRKFGEGFYLTQNATDALDEARKASLPTHVPVVLEFHMAKSWLEDLASRDEVVLDGPTLMLSHAARRPILDFVRESLVRCSVIP